MNLNEAIEFIESSLEEAVSVADKKIPAKAKRLLNGKESKELSFSNSLNGTFKDMNGKRGGQPASQTYFRLPSTGGLYRHWSTNDGDPKYVYGMSVPNNNHMVLFHTSKIEIVYSGSPLKLRGEKLVDFLSQQNESNLTEKRWKEGDEINDELRGALKTMRKHADVIYDLKKARDADRLDSYKLSSAEKTSIKALAGAVEILAKYRVGKASMLAGGKTAMNGMKRGEVNSNVAFFLYYLLNDMDMGKFGKEFDPMYSR